MNSNRIIHIINSILFLILILFAIFKITENRKLINAIANQKKDFGLLDYQFQDQNTKYFSQVDLLHFLGNTVIYDGLPHPKLLLAISDNSCTACVMEELENIKNQLLRSKYQFFVISLPLIDHKKYATLSDVHNLKGVNLIENSMLIDSALKISGVSMFYLLTDHFGQTISVFLPDKSNIHSTEVYLEKSIAYLVKNLD